VVYNTCCVTFGFQEHVTVKWHICQMIKPWMPRSYSKLSKRSPSVSRQTAVRRTAFFGKRLNMMASDVVTAACNKLP
jgi:hypothetical protein